MIRVIGSAGRLGPRIKEIEPMSGVGGRFPQFALTGVVSNDAQSAFQSFTHDSFAGRWKVLFFWPKDLTFVCPTELAAFGRLEPCNWQKGEETLKAA
jgi:alkyl hydroperoxide reductase subunit AhpC